MCFPETFLYTIGIIFVLQVAPSLEASPNDYLKAFIPPPLHINHKPQLLAFKFFIFLKLKILIIMF
jgi:hypothetical protein